MSDCGLRWATFVERVDDKEDSMSGTISPITGTAPAGAEADADALKADIAETRDHLGDTVDALADKAAVGSRAKDTARRATAKVGERARTATGRVNTSVRTQPARWASVAGGVLAAAAVGVVAWRRSRVTPPSRAARAWAAVTERRLPARWPVTR
ncbi:MAG TPA: DUF3618 domain-containing protein [Micromonosporaceae bacterium]|nr:DUF3618 domain-containing protein [Micromonosporaceae bacterium]